MTDLIRSSTAFLITCESRCKIISPPVLIWWETHFLPPLKLIVCKLSLSPLWIHFCKRWLLSPTWECFSLFYNLLLICLVHLLMFSNLDFTLAIINSNLQRFLSKLQCRILPLNCSYLPSTNPVIWHIKLLTSFHQQTCQTVSQGLVDIGKGRIS